MVFRGQNIDPINDSSRNPGKETEHAQVQMEEQTSREEANATSNRLFVTYYDRALWDSVR